MSPMIIQANTVSLYKEVIHSNVQDVLQVLETPFKRTE